MTNVGPSQIFPTGLTPSKQNEIQLNNVELEGKVCSAIPLAHPWVVSNRDLVF